MATDKSADSIAKPTPSGADSTTQKHEWDDEIERLIAEADESETLTEDDFAIRVNARD